MSAAPQPKAGVSKGLLSTLAGVVVLALVGVFVVLPLLSGDDVPEGPVALVPAVSPTPAPTVEPSEELPPITETFEVFSARDPFQQLVSDEAAPTVEGQPTGNASEPVTGDPVSTTPPGETTEGGTTVVVEDVFADEGTEYVLLTANGTAYTLAEGDTFATDWRVEAIEDPCVTLLYGDQARLVCEGESVRK